MFPSFLKNTILKQSSKLNMPKILITLLILIKHTRKEIKRQAITIMERAQKSGQIRHIRCKNALMK